MIIIESKKIEKSLGTKYPNSLVLDLTSRGEPPWNQLSPSYPHGNIPIPLTEGYYSESVEGVWQGLKVFINADVDVSKFYITNMKGIKRTVSKNGLVKGHRKGVNGTSILDYKTARQEIYIKTYTWVLNNKVNEVLALIIAEAQRRNVVFVDYETNGDINNIKTPL